MNTGLFYLGTAGDLHHFRADMRLSGAEFFAVRRSAFKTPIEFAVGSQKPVDCYDWFMKDLKQHLSVSDAALVKRIIAVPVRDAQASEEK